MSVIGLIRHGKTAANERHLYCGATDEPLSRGGIEGLEKLKTAGGYPAADAFKLYTSGMWRAVQTAEILFPGIPQCVCRDMREMDFGEFEMHSYDELKTRDSYIKWISDETETMPCPGGESAAEFKRRVFAAFDFLAALDENALIVCHGGVISDIMLRAFPKEQLNFYQWQPRAGEGYALTIENGMPVNYAKIPNAL